MNACGSNDMASLCASICFFSEQTHPASVRLSLHLCLFIRHLPIISRTIHPSVAVVCCHHLRPSVCPRVRPQRVSVRSLYVLSVCENVCIDIRSIICPLRPSCAPRSSEGCDFLLLRSRFSSVFHSGVKRGVCSQINHFPEDADFDHDGAEYVLRKSKAALSRFSGECVYFF